MNRKIDCFLFRCSSFIPLVCLNVSPKSSFLAIYFSPVNSKELYPVISGGFLYRLCRPKGFLNSFYHSVDIVILHGRIEWKSDFPVSHIFRDR
jgi:hypothetical protein